MHPDPDMHCVLLAATQLTLSEPVRGYEMGPDRRLPLSGFARYFEHMRWELGRRGRVAEAPMPRRGVVRAQTHRYLLPLRFPCVWTGTSQLIHVGGSSMHFGHALTGDDGQVVVQGRTVIVLLDGSNRPASAPDYLRDYVDASFEAPTPFAVPEPAWTNIATYAVTVRPSDHDSFDHVNHARYIDFVEDTLSNAGLGRMRAISLSYDQEARAGDTLLIELGAANPPENGTSHTVRHAFRMVRKGDGVVVNRGALELSLESVR